MSIIEQDAITAGRSAASPSIHISDDLPTGPIARLTPRHNGFLSRTQILEATEATFAETGYDGTTIRAIAGRMGCSVGSIYRYFTDKRELLLAAAAAAMRPVLEGLDAGDTLAESQRVYLDQATGHAELYRLMFWLAWTPEQPGLPEPIAEVVTRWASLAGSVAQANQTWAALHGSLMLGDEVVAKPAAESEANRVVVTPPPIPAGRPAAVPEVVVPEFEPEPVEDVTLL